VPVYHARPLYTCFFGTRAEEEAPSASACQ
jgi:hypothetical protein